MLAMVSVYMDLAHTTIEIYIFSARLVYFCASCRVYIEVREEIMLASRRD